MTTEALATRAEFHLWGLPEAACASVAEETIDGALLGATSKAYSYLRSRYTLPLVSWGQDLRMAVCAIAAFHVLNFRGWNPSNPADASTIKAHDDAVAWLEKVARGHAAADIVDTAPAARQGARVFSQTPRGYRRPT